METEEKKSKIDKNSVINAEVRRLKKICGKVPKDTMQVVKQLIEHIAFSQYMLLLMEEDITANGIVVNYEHGRGNTGSTANPAVKAHNSTMTVYLKALKQLADIVFKDAPPEEKASKLDAFRFAE